MTVYRELLFFLVNLCFLYMPEVNICSAGSASGKRVGIRNTDVPNDEIVNCSCDIQSQGPINIEALFDGPGFDNCGTRLNLQNIVFTCHHGSTTIVSTTTRLNFDKTYSDNDKWCMFFDAGEHNISITCYGIGDQLPEITTTRYLATSTTSVSTALETTSSSSSQKPYNLTTITNTLSTAISELPSQTSTIHARTSQTHAITTMSSLISSSTIKETASDSTTGTIPRVTTAYTQPVSHGVSVDVSTKYQDTTATTKILSTAISELPSTSSPLHTSTSQTHATSTISSLTSSSTPNPPASDSTTGTVQMVTTAYTQLVSHDSSVDVSTSLITTDLSSVSHHVDTTLTSTAFTSAQRTAARLPELAIILISTVSGILLIATVIAIIVHVVRKRGPNYNQNDTEDAINDPTSGSVINAYNPRHSSAITNPMDSNLDVARNNNGLSSFHVESSPTYASINKHPGPNYENNTFPAERSIVRSPGIQFKSPVPEAVDETQESGTSDLYAVVNKPGSNQDNENMHTENSQVGPMKGIMKNQTRHKSDNVNRFDKAEENEAVKFNNDHMPDLEQYPGHEKYTTDGDKDMNTINPNYVSTTSGMTTAL